MGEGGKGSRDYRRLTGWPETPRSGADASAAGSPLAFRAGFGYLDEVSGNDLRTMRALSFIIVLGLAAGAAMAAEFEVRQVEKAFMPERLRVSRGSVVQFANDEKFVHHAFVDTPEFSADSGDIPPGEARGIAFTRAGTYIVRCAIHPQMRMTVEVSEE